MYYCIIVVLLTCLIFSCTSNYKDKRFLSATAKSSHNQIVLLPLGAIEQKTILAIRDSLQLIFNEVKLLSTSKMPSNAYYAPRNRYRADSLIRWMFRRANKNEIYVGITSYDISTTKADIADYGVMGLGYQPGNACVASNYRLKSKKPFYKIVIHELGHTAGLPHCPNKTCYMRDAEGGDHTSQENGFCISCKAFLQEKGWYLL